MMKKHAVPMSSILAVLFLFAPFSSQAAPGDKALGQLREAAGPDGVREVPAVIRSQEPASVQEHAVLTQEAETPAVACYALARNKLGLTVWGAVMLCSGTTNAPAPVSCFGTARSRLTDLGSALLCTGTASADAPVACYDQAVKLDLTAMGAATLCHAADNAVGRIACYREARNHLNATGAVELCGRLPFEMYVQIYGKDKQEAASLIQPSGR